MTAMNPPTRLHPPGPLQRRRMGRARAARRRLPHLRPPRLDRADLQPHLAARPGRGPHYLINPFGLHYSRGVRVEPGQGRSRRAHRRPRRLADQPGRNHLPRRDPRDPARRALRDAPAHDGDAGGLLPEGRAWRFTNFYAAQLFGKIAYHDFEGITVHADEGARILESARGKPVLLLRNHGPVTIGATLPQALVLMWTVQRACEIQLATQSMGEAIADPACRARQVRRRLVPVQPEVQRRRGRLRRAAPAGRPQGPGLPPLAEAGRRVQPGAFARVATSCFSICSVFIAPAWARPSSNTSPGVPRMRCFWPSA